MNIHEASASVDVDRWYENKKVTNVSRRGIMQSSVRLRILLVVSKKKLMIVSFWVLYWMEAKTR